MHTIKAASRLTGVPAATLRAWERRYGVVQPARTDGGYRVYDDDAIAALQTMRTLVDEGWAPAQAAEQIRAASRGEPIPPPGGPATQHDQEIQENLAGTTSLAEIAESMDLVALERVLDEQFSRASFESVVDDWLMPALAQVGAAWRAGRLTIAAEHQVAAAITRRLAAAYDAAATADLAPHVVVGLPPGGRHEIGLLAFATAARRRGIATAYLGADLPAAAWAAAIRSHGARGAVLTVSMESDAGPAAEVVQAIRAESPSALVAVGGQYQQLAPAPCVPMGHRIGPAAHRLGSLLGV